MTRRYEVLPWGVIVFILLMLGLAYLSYLGWERWSYE